MMYVRDVMSSPPVVVDAGAGITEVAALLRRHRISGLPVVDDRGHLRGVVSEADLLRRLVKVEIERTLGRPPKPGAQGLTDGTVADLMTTSAAVVRAESPLDDALRIMRRHASHRLPVVDRSGRPVGVVTRTDLLAAFLRADREILDELTGEVLTGLGIDVARVRLGVSDGNVSIAGPVADRATLHAVEAALREVDGVVSVESRLCVESIR
ncbi:MAG: CBS domain-containing protein [Candidatus Dormibacteraceae bacterium]